MKLPAEGLHRMVQQITDIAHRQPGGRRNVLVAQPAFELQADQLAFAFRQAADQAAQAAGVVLADKRSIRSRRFIGRGR